jgi:hypothetical protein
MPGQGQGYSPTITAASIATSAIGDAELAPFSGVPSFATKTLTFTGATNFGEANSSATLFTVTGEVLVVAISPICTTDLTGAASTVSLGVTGDTDLFIALTTATTIDAGMFWQTTTPKANGTVLAAICKDVVITDSILVESLTQNTTGGVLRVDVYWLPLSTDGNLVAA